MATQTKDVENYLEKPVKKETTKEQVIYGGGDPTGVGDLTQREVESESAEKTKQLLTEGS